MDDVLKTKKEECKAMIDVLDLDECNIKELCDPIWCCHEALFDSKPFKYPPVCMYSINALADYIIENCDGIKDSVRQAIFLMDKSNINTNKRFWIYQDGVNWDMHLVNDYDLRGYLKECVEYIYHEDIDELDSIYMLLRKLTKQDLVSDGLKFFELMGFINVSLEHDLNCGPKEAIDVYNKINIEIEKIGKKYHLYNADKACSDPWYEVYTLWPKMNDFFKKHIIKGDMHED